MNQLANTLQQRLINFSSNIIEISRQLPSDYAGKYLSQQLLRSGLSPSLNYAEACSAESKSDFLHKMKICLKELRESNVSLILISKNMPFEKDITPILKESDELISIFVKSIHTASQNKNKL